MGGFLNMKRTLTLILLLGALAFLAAQTYSPINPVSDEDEVYYDDEIMLINEDELEAETGFLGIYVDDLNFPKAQALKYNKNHGVLILGVVEDSPAAAANLQKDDIIMIMNDQVVTNKQKFIEICEGTKVGDEMKLKIWRNGAEQAAELTLGEKIEDDGIDPSRITVSFKPNLTTGYGGGGWIPMWATVDVSDINELLEELYFEPMREKGMLMQGGAGKMHIGKGFFFGLQGASYADKGKSNTPATAADQKLRANYIMSTFEFTIDKRFAVKPWLVLSIGTGLGSAKHKVELYRDESDSTWPANNNYGLGYHKAALKKSYLTVHPRFEALFPLVSWFGLRMEAGYNYGFSPNRGWREEEYNGEYRHITNSPETKFGAFTISAGPWFGF